MNKRGGFISGLMFTLVFFIFVISLFAFIEPLKENFDNSRGLSSTLNCPGTSTHDATDYQNDTQEQKLIRRPVCFVTGLGMVGFVGIVLVALILWIYRKWLN